MIIDVHSHSPQYRGAVPAERRKINPAWRPDRSVSSVYNWEEYLEEQAPADVAIVFGVAWYPGDSTGGVNGVDESSDMPGNVNDKTAAFAKAYPERLIGFMSLHPHDPHALDELARCKDDLGLRGIKLGRIIRYFIRWNRASWPSMNGRSNTACRFSFTKAHRPCAWRRYAMPIPC